MGKKIDLTGREFGELRVIAEHPERKNKKIYWVCKCSCGTEKLISGSDLKSGKIKSCGCLKTEILKSKEMIGKRFNRLVVIEETKQRKDSQIVWKCQCDCGNTVIVRGAELSNNHTKSCGCLRSGGEYNIIQWLEKNNIEYESQKKFPNLVGINGGNLSYDFYLPIYNLLIEAQGQQHITPKKLFGGEEQFQKQKEHDKRKRDYAEVNGSKLLEIWYYDYDRIEEILNKELEVR